MTQDNYSMHWAVINVTHQSLVRIKANIIVEYAPSRKPQLGTQRTHRQMTNRSWDYKLGLEDHQPGASSHGGPEELQSPSILLPALISDTKR